MRDEITAGFWWAVSIILAWIGIELHLLSSSGYFTGYFGLICNKLPIIYWNVTDLAKKCLTSGTFQEHPLIRHRRVAATIGLRVRARYKVLLLITTFQLRVYINRDMWIISQKKVVQFDKPFLLSDFSERLACCMSFHFASWEKRLCEKQN